MQKCLRFVNEVTGSLFKAIDRLLDSWAWSILGAVETYVKWLEIVFLLRLDEEGYQVIMFKEVIANIQVLEMKHIANGFIKVDYCLTADANLGKS